MLIFVVDNDFHFNLIPVPELDWSSSFSLTGDWLSDSHSESDCQYSEYNCGDYEWWSHDYHYGDDI